MNRRALAAYIGIAVAVVALWAWAVHGDPVPEARMPDTSAATPVDMVQHMICDNCVPTPPPTATEASLFQDTPTPAFPPCPTHGSQYCIVPFPTATIIAPTVIDPVMIPTCMASTLATITPGDICMWMGG